MIESKKKKFWRHLFHALRWKCIMKSDYSVHFPKEQTCNHSLILCGFACVYQRPAKLTAAANSQSSRTRPSWWSDPTAESHISLIAGCFMFLWLPDGFFSPSSRRGNLSVLILQDMSHLSRVIPKCFYTEQQFNWIPFQVSLRPGLWFLLQNRCLTHTARAAPCVKSLTSQCVVP